MKRFTVMFNCSDREWDRNSATDGTNDFAWMLKLFLTGGLQGIIPKDTDISVIQEPANRPQLYSMESAEERLDKQIKEALTLGHVFDWPTTRRTINCIKVVRNLTGWGLKESKHYVDDFRNFDGAVYYIDLELMVSNLVVYLKHNEENDSLIGYPD